MSAPFLITGQGRSGTLFLSRVLNLSPTWTVEHERPFDNYYFWNQSIVDLALERFRPNTGHVNSQLRRMAPQLMERGITCHVIVRDPRDILRSVHAARRRTRDEFVTTLREIIPGFGWVTVIASLRLETIRFEQMVTDMEYLTEIAWRVGVTDIPWAQVDLADKANAGVVGTVPGWAEWTAEECESFDRRLGWFMRTFGYQW